MTDSVLIISGTEKGQESLSSLVGTYLTGEPDTVATCCEARRLLIEREYELVLIDSPLPDEFGQDIACEICRNSTAGVIMMVKSELADEISSSVEDFGVFVLAKPIRRRLFYQALKLVSAARYRLIVLQAENIKLHQKIKEVRLVDRAKYTLMQYLKMTEPQAHRFIEKNAMDMRITRREVAEGILRTYES